MKLIRRDHGSIFGQTSMPKALKPVPVTDGSRFGAGAVSSSECVEVDGFEQLTSCGAGYVLEDPSMHSKVVLAPDT